MKPSNAGNDPLHLPRESPWHGTEDLQPTVLEKRHFLGRLDEDEDRCSLTAQVSLVGNLGLRRVFHQPQALGKALGPLMPPPGPQLLTSSTQRLN